MGSTHYSSQTPVFANVMQKVKYDEKISLISSKNRLLWRTHFAKKFFREMFTNMKNYSLHTIRSSHGFHQFFLFRQCSRIVCSGLIRNLFHIFMFYILKSTYLYHSGGGGGGVIIIFFNKIYLTHSSKSNSIHTKI